MSENLDESKDPEQCRAATDQQVAAANANPSPRRNVGRSAAFAAGEQPRYATVHTDIIPGRVRTTVTCETIGSRIPTIGKTTMNPTAKYDELD